MPSMKSLKRAVLTALAVTAALFIAMPVESARAGQGPSEAESAGRIASSPAEALEARTSAGDSPEATSRAELEGLISSGISVWDLQQVTDVAIVDGRRVDPSRFSAIRQEVGPSGAVEDVEVPPDEWARLCEASAWEGPLAGAQDEQLESYPVIEGTRAVRLTVDGSEIHSLGLLDVPALGRTFLYCSSSEEPQLTNVLLRPEQTVCVHYELTEFPIGYRVFEETDAGLTDITDSERAASVFGSERPGMTTNRWFSVHVTVPAGSIGRVYLAPSASLDGGPTLDGARELFPQESGYGAFALGEDVQWTRSAGFGSANNVGGVIDGSGTHPAYFTLNGSYSSGGPYSVDEDATLIAVLRKRTASDYAFDASFALGEVSGNQANRSKLYEYSGGRGGAETLPGAEAGTVNDDGTFDCTWTFSTTSSGTHFDVHSLSLNGVDLSMPFVGDLNEELPDPLAAGQSGPPRSRTTQLPLGAEATVTVQATVNMELGQKRQRTYTVSVRHSPQDVVFDSATVINAEQSYTELVLSELHGVECQVFRKDNGGSEFYWHDAAQSSSVRTIRNGGDGTFDYARVGAAEGDAGVTGNIRFRLESGYSDRSVELRFREKLADANANDLSQTWDDVRTTETDGWYYLTLPDLPRAPYHDIALLSIVAKPIDYEVHYLDGTEGDLNAIEGLSVSGMPFEPSRIDDNRGNRYSEGTTVGNYRGTVSSNRISIAGSPPAARGERAVSFGGWVLTDSGGHPLDARTGELLVSGADGYDEGSLTVVYPSDLVPLADLSQGARFASLDADDLREIYLSARWVLSDESRPLTYYVTYNCVDSLGIGRKRIQGEPFEGPYDGQEGARYVHERTMAVSSADYEQGLGIWVDDGMLPELACGADAPWYRYDMERIGRREGADGEPRSGAFYWSGVKDGDELPVWFTSNLRRLTVSKALEGDGEADGAFRFHVSFTLPADDARTPGDEAAFFDADGSSEAVYGLSGSSEGKALTLVADGAGYSGTLELKAGETATFELPIGTRYTIAEDVDVDRYEVSSPAGGICEGTLAEDRYDAAAAFVNTVRRRATGGIRVMNEVAGTAADPDREFSFQLDFSESPVAFRALALGEGTDFRHLLFKLKGGASFTVDHVPAGTRYSVMQTDAGEEGYTTSVDGKTEDVIPEGDVVEVRFTNTRNAEPGVDPTSPGTTGPAEPDDPDEPGGNDPAGPGEPDDPDAPGDPGDPEDPEGAEDPGAPTDPGGADGPDAPGSPDAPDAPDAPDSPTGPDAPGPSEPADDAETSSDSQGGRGGATASEQPSGAPGDGAEPSYHPTGSKGALPRTGGDDPFAPAFIVLILGFAIGVVGLVLLSPRRL